MFRLRLSLTSMEEHGLYWMAVFIADNAQFCILTLDDTIPKIKVMTPMEMTLKMTMEMTTEMTMKMTMQMTMIMTMMMTM